MFSLSKVSKCILSPTILSKRFKSVVVAIDGSNCGWAALKTTLNECLDNDKIHCIHIPENLEMYGRDQRDMFIPQNMDDVRSKMIHVQSTITDQIEKKCHKMKTEYTESKTISFDVIINKNELRTAAKHEIIKYCYDVQADLLVVGSKGISHTMKEKISEFLDRLGSVSDYCSHHAPCDVMIVKDTHEY
eukprot:148976_1